MRWAAAAEGAASSSYCGCLWLQRQLDAGCALPSHTTCTSPCRPACAPQVRHIKESTNAFDKDHKLHTYSIGIEGAPLPLPPPPLPLLLEDMLLHAACSDCPPFRHWHVCVCDSAAADRVEQPRLGSLEPREPDVPSLPPAAAGSPDLIAARKVADFLGTIHTEFTFTVGGSCREEGCCWAGWLVLCCHSVCSGSYGSRWVAVRWCSSSAPYPLLTSAAPASRCRSAGGGGH